MLRRQTLALILASACGLAADFRGARALEDVKKIVALGPRFPASAAMIKQQAYLMEELKACGCEVLQDAFTARTPQGPVAMKNLIARFPGRNGKTLVITGHYDTKQIKGVNFLGANDGAASSAMLLELARALKDRAHQSEIFLVWFDGEEAYGEWSANDSLYGSRHLADKWQKEGVLGRVQALINVDMIGDRDLVVEQEMYSSSSLRSLVLRVAQDLGYGKYFDGRELAIEDDHVPFLRRGVRALDLIDFDYGPNHSWWHAAGDTPDKLSANSLDVVGRVLLETLKRLDP